MRDPVVLVLGSVPLACRRCQLFARTGRKTEVHHLGGRPSEFVVEVDANLHAWLTLYQRCWRGVYERGSREAVLADLATLIAAIQDGLGGATA